MCSSPDSSRYAYTWGWRACWLPVLALALAMPERSTYGQDRPVAEEPAPEVDALRQVLYFRGAMLGDDTLVDACALRNVLPPGLDIGDLHAPRVTRLSGYSFENCESPVEELLAAARDNVVRADSVQLGAAGGSLWITVKKGENTLVEHHFLSPRFPPSLAS